MPNNSTPPNPSSCFLLTKLSRCSRLSRTPSNARISHSVGMIMPSVTSATEPCSIDGEILDRKSTRLNSSHVKISYAVFCLKKKNMDVPGGHLITTECQL